MLLNLASVVNAERPDMLWGFIRRYSPGATPESAPFLARLVDHAVAYYQDFVRPEEALPRARRERSGRRWSDLAETLARHCRRTPAEDIQNGGLRGRQAAPFAELRAWFGCLYQVLLGQHEGPRFGAVRRLVRARRDDRA